MSFLRLGWLHVVLRLVVGGFFLYASLDKIASPPAFAKIVYQWQIGGPVFGNLVAVILPWVEGLAGILLIAGIWKRESAVVIALMLLVFIGAAASVIARGIDVENCGCTSVKGGGSAVGFGLIARNLALLLGTLVLAFVRTRARDAAPRPAGAELPDGLSAGPGH